MSPYIFGCVIRVRILMEHEMPTEAAKLDDNDEEELLIVTLIKDYLASGKPSGCLYSYPLFCRLWRRAKDEEQLRSELLRYVKCVELEKSGRLGNEWKRFMEDWYPEVIRRAKARREYVEKLNEQIRKSGFKRRA